MLRRNNPIPGKETITINEYLQLLKNLSNSSSKVVHLPLFLTKSIANIAWRLNKTKIHPSYLKLIAQDQYFDISKAKKILNWEPKHLVEDALIDTLNFVKKEKIWK